MSYSGKRLKNEYVSIFQKELVWMDQLKNKNYTILMN